MQEDIYARNYIKKQIGYNPLIEEIEKLQYQPRSIKTLLEKYIKKFLAGHIAERWIVMPGLRGVGKTTLMSQIYNWTYKNYVKNKVKRDELNIIYISLDVLNRLNCDLMHFLRVYESILGCYLEKASQPVFFFIDEVQVDNNWAKVLKTVGAESDQ